MAKDFVPIDLGDRVKDTITGLTGIATCRTEWLNGCRRVGLQPEEVKDGKVADPQYFDENQLEIVQKNVHEPIVLEPVKASKPAEVPTRGGPGREGAGFRR